MVVDFFFALLHLSDFTVDNVATKSDHGLNSVDFDTVNLELRQFFIRAKDSIERFVLIK